MSYWTPYRPSDLAPWNLSRVVHLHRRAGFGATWHEIHRDWNAGPQAAIDRLLNGETYTAGAPDNFDSVAQVIGDAAIAADNPNRLKAWWLYRLVFSPDPLTERLVLMWHNHFATSNLKVQALAAMRRQNEIFREFGRAPFRELLTRVVKDPAMLIWLDAQANRKEHPNENLAREIMELFTLGVGNYTEPDVKEAARTLTGWTVKNGQFRDEEKYHDDGEKTVLDKTGQWRGDDLVRMLLEHPATARRLVYRICELLMGEGAIGAGAVAELALGLQEHDLDIGWAVETVLRSEVFFSERNIGNRVLGPVQFVVGALRGLEMTDPPPSTLLVAEWTAKLGQDLFYPPNVFGWQGGRSWISSRSIIGRANFAAALVSGALHNPARPLDAAGLAERSGFGNDASRAADFYCDLLVGRRLLLEVLGSVIATEGQKQLLTPELASRMVVSVLALPEAQLG